MLGCVIIRPTLISTSRLSFNFWFSRLCSTTLIATGLEVAAWRPT